MSNHGDSTQKKDKTPEEKHLDAVKGLTHHFVNTYDGGKCLWRGMYGHKAHSCCYRYQAIGRANEDKGVYNWPAYKEAADKKEKIQTDYRRANKETGKKAYPGWYRPELKAPSNKDWDIKGKNFESTRKPYWNQAHHIIPIGSFHQNLLDLAKGLAETRLSKGNERMISTSDILTYIQKSLLHSEYNINHKINMIILPMDNSVSKILRLPTHGGPSGNNHDQYNKDVKSELDKIMSAYRSYFCDLPDKEHLSEKHRRAQKRRLELLSERIYKLITRDSLRGEQSANTDGKSLESESPKWKDAMEQAGGPRVPTRNLGGDT